MTITKQLSEQQEKLLCIISKNLNKSISELGRMVYATNKSCYDVVYFFQENGLIEIEIKKNILIPKITLKGQKIVNNILKSKGL